MTTKERDRLTSIYARYVSGYISAVQAQREAGMYLCQIVATIQDENDGGMF